MSWTGGSNSLALFRSTTSTFSIDAVPFIPLRLSASGGTYTDPALAPHQQYYYKAVSIGSNGVTSTAATTNATPHSAPPVNFQALYPAATSHAAVDLFWTPTTSSA